jgi:hypothetical protein
MEMMLWWTPAIPEEYQKSLEKLPAGNYKLIAQYKLPQENQLGSITISDTVDFTFKAINENYLPTLIEMDSLYDYFHGIRGRDLAFEIMPRIRNSKTPYSEAAAAWLAVFNRSLPWPKKDIAAIALKDKNNFESNYSNSAFLPYVLYWLASAAIISGDKALEENTYKRLATLNPRDANVLLYEKKITPYIPER